MEGLRGGRDSSVSRADHGLGSTKGRSGLPDIKKPGHEERPGDDHACFRYCRSLCSQAVAVRLRRDRRRSPPRPPRPPNRNSTDAGSGIGASPNSKADWEDVNTILLNPPYCSKPVKLSSAT